MTYPVNNFFSSTYNNISANSAAPTAMLDTSSIPEGGYAMILGLVASNKSSDTRGINLTLQKSGAATSAYILYDVALPPRTSFQVVDGDKLIINRNDQLRIWADSAGTNLVDVVVSFVIYTPAS
jgi:hypothetical protein